MNTPLLYFNCLKSLLKGEFRLQKRSRMMFLVAVVYFFFPFDVIPDFVPFVGWIDDATLLAFVGNRLHKELDRFKLTRRSQ